VFLHMVFLLFLFFYNFFQNDLCWFYFFNIKLVKNYNYNIWESHCSFPHKLSCIAIVFFLFYVFFSKIVLVDFIFLILNWLRIRITNKVKLYGASTVASSHNNVDCYSVSLHGFFSCFFLCFIFYYDFF